MENGLVPYVEKGHPTKTDLHLKSQRTDVTTHCTGPNSVPTWYKPDPVSKQFNLTQPKPIYSILGRQKDQQEMFPHICMYYVPPLVLNYGLITNILDRSNLLGLYHQNQHPD